MQQTKGSNVNFNGKTDNYTHFNGHFFTRSHVVKTHDLKACVIYPIKLRILKQCGVVEHIE